MNLCFENDIYNNILNEINKNSESNNVCPICRDTMDNDKITLGCKHSYHSNCVINSFSSYESKKCMLCNKLIIMNDYSSICSKVMKNNKKCTRICYNQEKLCNLHLNQYLNEIKKNKKKINLSIDKKKDQIKKFHLKITNLKNEIEILEKKLII